MKKSELKMFLDDAVERFEKPDFMEHDPISIPHGFSKKQDIEISGLFAALLAWGQRVTIINKVTLLMDLMDNAPHDFILHHSDSDLKRFLNFKHRTFNPTDLLFIIQRLKDIYQEADTLEQAFVPQNKGKELNDVKSYLEHFHNFMFDADYAPMRSRKHIATPVRGSACKRLNMYLRWMVRSSEKGVDFGIWNQIKPSELIMPLDVHVLNTAAQLKLLKTDKAHWNTAEQLTRNLARFDPLDPVKYDFALFGLGVSKFFDKK
jgi:uncharacterized protein (TIGR02757 family)